MSILVTGGAGYIGSATAARLLAEGADVVVVDDLREGHRDAVPDGAAFHDVSLGDRHALSGVFRRHAPDAVFHFAASCLVGESMQDPVKYWNQNFHRTLDLLGVMRDHDCRRLVFSSTAATYGEPMSLPITEDHTQIPVNTYGATKLHAEERIRAAGGWGLRSASLRYFNASGAPVAGGAGEDHDPETHLIPLALQAADGSRGPLTVFGSDWDTPDGTCVRDYIHIDDLAQAHVLALAGMDNGLENVAVNLGNGTGYSVREVIDSVERVTGRGVPHSDGPRREGDPAVLVAGAEKAAALLGWKAAMGDLDAIVETAAAWHNTGWKARRR